MPDRIKVGIVGAGGRMGRTIAEGLAQDEAFEVAYLYDPVGGKIEGIGEIARDFESLFFSPCTHIVDFSTGKAVFEQGPKILLAGKRYLVGTTGYPEGTIEALTEACERGKTSCLVVPNFSIGANLMMKFSEVASKFFDYCEIVEAHHRAKTDAPSGTAKATARIVAENFNRKANVENPMNESRGLNISGVQVHAIRISGVLAEQEVIFGAEGETLRINHRTVSRTCYLPGVKLALKKLDTFQGLRVGLLSILEQPEDEK